MTQHQSTTAPAADDGPLRQFATAALYLHEAAPEALSLGQGAFFLLAAAADRRGRPLSPSEIADVGLRVDYSPLLAPASGLAWLKVHADGRGTLGLTPAGRAVGVAAITALRGVADGD
jgi:hypothetical protein